MASALGVHPNPALNLGFSDDHRFIALGTRHTDLLASPEVHATLRAWLSAHPTARPRDRA